MGAMAMALHLIDIGIHPRLHQPIRRLEEIAGVGGDLEPDQVVAQQALDQLLGVGEGAQQLEVGPGHMPELHQGELGIGPPQQLCRQRQVIVLQEHQGGAPGRLLEHHFGEAGIHLPVGVPMGRLKQGRHKGHMA